jgi:hypothetical protein
VLGNLGKLGKICPNFRFRFPNLHFGASPGRESSDQAANAVSRSSVQDDLPLEFHGMLQDKTESVVPQEHHPISGEYGTLQFKVRRL